MIFNEIYGCYYNAVAKMLELAVDGQLTEAKMTQIASTYAYEESLLTIIPAIKKQEWQLLDEKLHTPIRQKPTMPMTGLERRWLKTILQDKRIALFDVPMEGMEDVEPLYAPEDIVWFDRYLDGDPYEDSAYIENFRKIRQAIRERKKILIRFYNGKDQKKVQKMEPLKIEYSDKDDKFRVLCAGRSEIRTINLGRVLECTVLEETFPAQVSLPVRKKETLVFEVTDERNALERVMMKFAHYKKEAWRLEENRYRVEMEYDMEEETDVLIQILNFGSYVKVLAPDRLKEELKKRLKKQLQMSSQLFFRE